MAADGPPLQRRDASSAGRVRRGARATSTRGIELYDPKQVGKYAMITVDDPRVVMLTYLSWSLMCMGELDEATPLRRGGARRRARPRARVHAGARAQRRVLPRVDDRVAAVALQRLDELMPLLEEHGIAYYGAVGVAVPRAIASPRWARRPRQRAAAQGHGGLSRDRQPALSFRASCACRPRRMAASARLTTALEQIHEAFQLMYATSQRWDEAEIHRVYGGLLLAAGDATARSRRFRRALAIAGRRRPGCGSCAPPATSRGSRRNRERRRGRTKCWRRCAAGFEGQSGFARLSAARARFSTTSHSVS